MTRGEIYWADFGILSGSEPGFRRPAHVIQSDPFNRSRLPTTIVVPFSTNLALKEAPGNVFVPKGSSLLPKDSVVVVSQIITIDKNGLVEKAGNLSRALFEEVAEGIKMVLDLG